MKYEILFFTAVLLAFVIVGIPDAEQSCVSTSDALDTLINNTNKNMIGDCEKNALFTGINCTHRDNVTVNLTLFPDNGKVGIHYLALLSGGIVAANVTTSENYNGRMLLNSRGDSGNLSLFLTQLDSGIAFGANITGVQFPQPVQIFQNTSIAFECGTDSTTSMTTAGATTTTVTTNTDTGTDTTSTAINDTPNATCKGSPNGLPNGLNSIMSLVILLFAISYCV